MARLQPIIPLILWHFWLSVGTGYAWIDPWTGTAIYLCGLTLAVALMRWRSRRAMRRATLERPTPVPRFHRSMVYVRWGVLALHGVALFGLGCGNLVTHYVTAAGGVQTPQAFVSMLPLLLTWVGLIWTQYPLDRAVREQNALISFEYGEPVHAVPTLREYLVQAVRTQLLFTLAPLLAIWLLRDALTVLSNRLALLNADDADAVITVVAVGLGLLLSPELARRVLPTVPLPASALRDRLMALATRSRLKFREILLWQTHHSIGNAAVMGFLPRVRYVLLTDLLLETMTDDQIESVFAHELGHIAHRHLPWYVLFLTMMAFGLDEVSSVAARAAMAAGVLTRDDVQWIVPVVGIGTAVVLFGLLSRAFERQADFFAARRLADAGQPLQRGAAVFVSALQQVAITNNMPLDAEALTHGRRWLGRVVGRVMHHFATWLHGSIRSRMNHLTRLASRPAAAQRFDQRMLLVRCVILVGASASIAWAVVDRLGQGR